MPLIACQSEAKSKGVQPLTRQNQMYIVNLQLHINSQACDQSLAITLANNFSGKGLIS